MDKGKCALCERPREKREWCGTHYQRWRLHGDPAFTMFIRGDYVARLESKIDRSGGPDACHLWQGAPEAAGYGTLLVNGKKRKAHIVAWEVARGPLPDGMELDHECHNAAVRIGVCRPGKCAHRLCCNVLHLAAKTRAQHYRDTVPWARVSGEAIGTAKLTLTQAREIRSLRGTGLTQKQVASMYDISRTIISDIWLGKLWREQGPAT